jgi:hypothetical protein
MLSLYKVFHTLSEPHFEDWNHCGEQDDYHPNWETSPSIPDDTWGDDDGVMDIYHKQWEDENELFILAERSTVVLTQFCPQLTTASPAVQSG